MEAALRDPGAQDDEPMPLNPVALGLAVWLGMMVSAAGLVRLLENMPAPEMGHDAATALSMAFGFGV